MSGLNDFSIGSSRQSCSSVHRIVFIVVGVCWMDWALSWSEGVTKMLECKHTATHFGRDCSRGTSGWFSPDRILEEAVEPSMDLVSDR